MSANTDSEFLRIAVMILGALFAFMALMILVANLVFDSSGLTYQGALTAEERVSRNIQPVGQVRIAGTENPEQAAAAAPAVSDSAPAAERAPVEDPAPVEETVAASESTQVDGQQIYQSACFACHGTGAAGAPKLTDEADWAVRIAKGEAVLLDHAVNGFNLMPPKGGNMALRDADVAAAVAYMVETAGGKSAMEAAPVENEAPASQPAVAAIDGQQIYQTACFACHGTGAAGAPKLGDKAAWEARIAQGSATLLEHAVKGFKAMPPKGGRPDLSDAEVEAAIAYILNQSQ